MKTTFNLLAVGFFLVPVNAGFGQPVITNQPTSQATAPGTTLTFEVGAAGTTPLAYQWQKNSGTGFSDLADRTKAALVLANVQPWDACDYRVILTNIIGARTICILVDPATNMVVGKVAFSGTAKKVGGVAANPGNCGFWSSPERSA